MLMRALSAQTGFGEGVGEPTAGVAVNLVETWHQSPPLETPLNADGLAMLQSAHQLRSPLAAILNSLNMLLEGYAGSDSELRTEMLSLARDRAVSAMAMVNTSLQRGVLQDAGCERQRWPVQLLDVVHTLLPDQQTRAQTKSIELRLDAPTSLPEVNATVDAAEFLLSNLIDNAVKYSPVGSTITISLAEAGRRVLGVVEDSGIGILADDIPKSFDDFYRTQGAEEVDSHGIGLGLTIAKRLVGLHGGQLWVESATGKGSLFHFSFLTVDGMGGRHVSG